MNISAKFHSKTFNRLCVFSLDQTTATDPLTDISIPMLSRPNIKITFWRRLCLITWTSISAPLNNLSGSACLENEVKRVNVMQKVSWERLETCHVKNISFAPPKKQDIVTSVHTVFNSSSAWSKKSKLMPKNLTTSSSGC